MVGTVARSLGWWSPQEHEDHPPPVREVRVALVMNGGVSLAVWMGGATSELYDVIDASHPTPRGESDATQLWVELLQLTGLRVCVDVVAGTSAGGLNGALLAGSLARGAPYPKMREVWRDLPLLQRGALFRRADSEKSGLSILDGAYFHNEVLKQFAALPGVGDNNRATDVTCLITATAIGGTPRRIQDDFGSRQVASDHRRVYRFVRQQLRYKFDDRGDGRWTPDSRDDFTDVATLATAARVSSGFPVAFEPEPESVGLERRRVLGAGSRTYLMDGGVLDNAAFEPLLDEVRARPVDGPWRRVVAYLVPSASEHDEIGPAHDLDPKRPSLPEIVGAVVGASRESDSRLDLDALTTYRRLSRNSAMTPQSLLADARVDTDRSHDWRAAASELFDLYVETRANAALRADPVPADDSATAFIIQPQIEDLWREARDLSFIPDNLVVEPDEPWRWGTGTALRLLHWWARDLNNLWTPPVTALADLGVLQAEMQAVADTAESLRRELVGPDDDDLDDAGAARERLDRLRAWADHRTIAKCFATAGELVWKGATVYGAAVGLGDGESEEEAAARVLDTALRAEVILHATLWEDAIPDRPPLKFLRMGPDIESPAVPDGVGNERAWGSRKLYGTTVGHFGAFVDGDWRVHDWTWGRLDAAAHLVKMLASLGSASDIDVHDWTTRIQEAILDDEQTNLPDWHVSTLRTFANGGQTNKKVLDHLRRHENGQRSLTVLVDEVLHVVARAGKSRPRTVAEVTDTLRDWLYLEKPDADDDSGRGAVIGWTARRWIRKQIRNET